jgi:F-type H+-transporting ATPase subunit delta
MAELATIARPYADALFKAARADLNAAAVWLDALAEVAQNTQLQQFAGNPNSTNGQLFDLVAGVIKAELPDQAKNFLRTVIDNGRFAAVPEIAAQFRALKNAASGFSDGVVYSAYPMDGAALAEVTVSLEKRFGRKLNLSVVVDPELIGGTRVVVGDEVLDTSVKSRLEQMKVALTA